jgi:uncharacterized paraquat-inducible protein A
MNKTKLGFTNSFLAAIIFISGITTPLLMFGLIVYVLIFEEDNYVKISAKRAATIYAVFAIISGVWSVIDDLIRLLMSELGNYPAIYNKINMVITLLEAGSFIVMAFRTYTNQSVTTEGNQIDRVLDGMATSKVIVTQGSENSLKQEEYTYCSNCGSKMLKTDVFCNHCGTKRE